MWTVLKVFIEFATTLLWFYVLFFWLIGIGILVRQSGIKTHIPCIGKGSLNHWTSREVSGLLFKGSSPLDYKVLESRNHVCPIH